MALVAGMLRIRLIGDGICYINPSHITMVSEFPDGFSIATSDGTETTYLVGEEVTLNEARIVFGSLGLVSEVMEDSEEESPS